MALPELIEIVPLDKPVRAEITVPGSKSITNRALILAALADGEVTLKGALWSEDTQVMTEALQHLGFQIKIENDPEEFCNRTITVMGQGGKVPAGGTEAKPLELFVGNAGTAARFLSAFVCLGDGVYRLSGVPRMHERPQAALFQALREIGYRVESEKGNDKLPVKIFGGRADLPVGQDAQPHVPTKKCRVSIEESSQFASALLLSSKIGGWQIEVVGENAEESPYVVMTSKLMEAFPWKGGAFQIEPDASSGSYFLGAIAVAPGLINVLRDDFDGLQVGSASKIIVLHWPNSGLQIDENFPKLMLLPTQIGNNFSPPPNSVISSEIQLPSENWFEDLHNKDSWLWQLMKTSRLIQLGDAIMTAITIAPLNFMRREFRDLGRLRVQECERVVALRTELTKCGAKVVEEGDTLTVWPSKLEELHGAEIETYNDHRMAMCFAILGLKVPGIKIINPACVKKTFPNFFQKLAAPPPHGLGATILDAKSGRKLTHEELFAD